MTIIQLEYLLAVSNFGSFSQAAQACFVTQPSLSIQIKNLEEELGVVLLDRSKKPVVPTEMGKLVIDNARKTLKSYNLIKESLNELNNEIIGVLKVGVLPTISPFLLSRLIPDFTMRYPKAELQFVEMTATAISAALPKDVIDAAIVSSGVCRGVFQEYELFNDRFVGYVSSGNDLYERNSLRMEDIRTDELMLLSDSHCFRDQVLEVFGGRKNYHPPINFDCNSFETLMRVVDSTSNVTIIPEMAVPYVPYEKSSHIKTFAKGAISRKISLIVRRSYVKKSLVDALISSLRRVGK